VHRLGGAISPANPAYSASELEYQLKDSEATALITSSNLLPTALKAIEKLDGIPPTRVYVIDGKDHKSHKTVQQLIDEGRKSKSPFAPLRLAKGEGKKRLAFLSYSSGTTGLPKGVMISHYNIISNVLQMAVHGKDESNKRDVTLGLLPLYHIYGMILFRGID
jgi:long-subunit acyl-CoA synthetase (AMP-forming)